MTATIPGALLFVLTALTVCPTPANATPPDKTRQNRYRELFNQMTNLSPDQNRIAEVTSLTIRRDVGLFTLGSGTIYFCQPVDGRDCVVVFRGKGQFSMTPPTPIERDHLYRFSQKETVTEEFTELFLLFADSTALELQTQVRLSAGNVTNESREFVKYCLKYLCDVDDSYFHPSVFLSLLNNVNDEFFYAHFSKERIKPFFFEIDPHEDEEVRFMRRYPLDFRWDHEVINQFHTSDEYRNGIEQEEEKTDLHPERYEITAEIASNLDFKSRATLHLRLSDHHPRWAYFFIFNKFEVDSVLLAGSRPCEFVKPKDRPFLWVHIDPASLPGPLTLDIFYRGDLIRKIDALNWLAIRSSVFWYPRQVTREKSIFDITYVVHSDHDIISVGELQSRVRSDGATVSRWVTKSPIRNASFNIGVFNEWTIEDPSLPPVTVYMNESGHRSVATIEDEVRHDIGESLKLFQHIFGPPQFESLRVTEIPYMHGEAFPGLLHLSWTTYEPSALSEFLLSDRFIPESHIQFRGHEVAHQWWGVGVDFLTYHDQWLSEAFAEYSGLWYTQLALRDNELFLEILEKWRENILSNRKFILGSGQEAGPIWMGYRTQGSETSGDYGLIIYKKGAWVLHMLRGMLIDLRTMNEDRFEGLLREFYTSYVGRKASTEDFRKVVEKHAGEDMEWFFDQWVYGTEIPTYRYAVRTEEQDDGRYDLLLKVTQSEVSDDFRMPVTLSILLKDGRTARMRVTVSESKGEFRIPGLPSEPDEVIFNDLESVLCEAEEVEW